MDSFYGGKQGISFVIKDNFDSIAAMDTKFADSSYEKTWYGEHCIINTTNRNSSDNGKIFRRTAYHANSEGGSHYAEYIGQIVGPAGGIPNIEINNLDGLKNAFNNLDISNGNTIYYKNSSSGRYTTTYPAITTPADQLSIIQDTATVSAIYKSGASYAANTTPAFKYGFYTFQSGEDNQGLATLGIGFEIPYVDFDTPSVSMIPQDSTPAVVASHPNANNPFLWHYDFQIPGGKPGPYMYDIQTVQVKLFPQQSSTDFVAPSLYSVSGINYTPNGNPPYTNTGSVLPASTFNSSLVFAGKFRYQNQNGQWQNSNELFYLGDAPTIENAVTRLETGDTQYKLYVKYGDHDGGYTITTQNNQTVSGYTYVGYVGPQSIGPWAKQLNGATSDNNGNITIPITGSYTSNIPSSTSEGNLGVVAGSEVSGLPETLKSSSFFFLWTGSAGSNQGEWKQLGVTSYSSANIETGFDGIKFKNANMVAELYAETIEDSTPASFEDAPWK